jgi:hypothetical protein
LFELHVSDSLRGRIAVGSQRENDLISYKKKYLSVQVDNIGNVRFQINQIQKKKKKKKKKQLPDLLLNVHSHPAL